MKLEKHIIFVGQEPRIFRRVSKANRQSCFKFYYNLDIQNTLSSLDKIFSYHSADDNLIFIIIDIEFVELESLLGLIKAFYESKTATGKRLAIYNYLFIPLIDLLNPVRLNKLLNQILFLAKLGLQALLVRSVDLDKLELVTHDFLS